MKIKAEVEELFRKVRKPLTYIASEENAVFKPSARLKVCLIYPDLYELGIASLGLNILYSVLNGEEGVWAQRAYMPNSDMLTELEDENITLFSLEEQRPLKEFDILGFSLPHELCYTNVLRMLKAAHISIRSDKRKNDEPLVIAGGGGAYNPVPMARFIDAFVIGEGEEVIVEIANKVRSQKSGVGSEKRLKTLKVLSEIEGVWVPEIHQRPTAIGERQIKKRLVKDINMVSYTPLVPATRGENRLVVELMRGCTAGCRFCQAGFIYRPLREKDAGFALSEATENISGCGLNSLSLLSLNTSDYSQIAPLVRSLAARLSDKKVSISLPSLRIDDLSVGILKDIASVKKTGLTFAIEAGSQRLRNLVNKRLSEEQIINTLEKVFANGWTKVKLYFMVGLPTENQEDLDELVRLVYKIARVAKTSLDKRLARKLNIIVSVSNFVPKPHTPFQWVAQDSLQKLNKKHRFLMDKIKGPAFKLRWHNSKQSTVEGLIARGDLKTADVIEKAYELGAIFDNFSERFDFSIWKEAAKKAGVKIEDYLKTRPINGELPWDFIDIGVSEKFIKQEFEKSLEGLQTADCRSDKCPKCGLCDKEIKNRFSSELRLPRRCAPRNDVYGDIPASHFENAGVSPSKQGCPPMRQRQQSRHKYRLILQKEHINKYLSHLEWISWIERGLRKTDVSLVMKGHYNPRPKLSFSAALPVGSVSKQAFVDFQVKGSHSQDKLIKSLRKVFSSSFSELQELVVY